MRSVWWIKPDELDADQKEAIALDTGSSHLIIGPAGSGKTNLLLLRARYLTLKRISNIQIITFTGALQRFLQAGCDNYNLPPNRAATAVTWARRFLYDNGLTPKMPADASFEEVRESLFQEIENLVNIRNLGPQYDVILLDESQDFRPGEISLFNRLSRTLFAVADARQKIYKGDDPLPELESICGPPTRLRYHYRNGLAICRFADALASPDGGYESLAATSNYDEATNASRVEARRCGGIEEELALIVASLTTQVRVFPGELLGVLYPRTQQVEQALQALKDSEIKEFIVSDLSTLGGTDESSRVYVTTCHSAKGLEFRAVHFGGMESIYGLSHPRNVAFTATTRAKTSLSLYHSNDVLSFLDGALDTLRDPAPDPSIDDVFSRN